MSGIPNATFGGLLALNLVFAASAVGQTNLLVNGNFEFGNTGFSSGYTYSPGDIQPQGLYDVVSNPNNDHPNATSFPDHTSGQGLMLAVNGGSDPTQIVWSETVNVTRDTTYFLSGWGASWGGWGGSDPAPAQLVFSVNGTQLGNPVGIPAANAVWQSFTAIWSSGCATQAVIQIKDLNALFTGNDFALDDLVFAPLQANPVSGVRTYSAVEVCWPSISNRTYQVQWSSAAQPTNWFNLGSPVVAVGTNTTVWDRVGPRGRFYRVLPFQ